MVGLKHRVCGEKDENVRWTYTEWKNKLMDHIKDEDFLDSHRIPLALKAEMSIDTSDDKDMVHKVHSRYILFLCLVRSSYLQTAFRSVV